MGHQRIISPHRALGPYRILVTHKALSPLRVLGPHRVLVLTKSWVLLGSWVLIRSWDLIRSLVLLGSWVLIVSWPVFLVYLFWHICSSWYEHEYAEVSHYNTFYFLRYAHVRYVKRLFTNIQKQQNMSQISLIFKKFTKFTHK